MISTPKSTPRNPKVEGASGPQLARLEALKEVKDLKDLQEGPTPNAREEWPNKPERQSPFWCETCGVAIPSCAHRVIYLTPQRRLAVGHVRSG
jgi:hypothetical protein